MTCQRGHIQVEPARNRSPALPQPWEPLGEEEAGLAGWGQGASLLGRAEATTLGLLSKGRLLGRAACAPEVGQVGLQGLRELAKLGLEEGMGRGPRRRTQEQT